MTSRTVFAILAICVAAYVLYRGNDPHRTSLPFGTDDLTTVQKQLAKLPKEERTLVEAYVKRSRGDVLPPKFADPDVPLTARTFGEAIQLQRAWEAKMKLVDARVAEIRAQREVALAPLRATVNASVIRAEIITRNEYQARKDPSFNQRAHRVDDSPSFLVSIRLDNTSDEFIVGLRGSLQARDSEAYLPMDLCWISFEDDGRPIPPHGFRDITCGHDYRGASKQQQDFVANPKGRFNVEWEPKYVKLGNGQRLEAKVD
jgi:hypothetical protein